MAIEYKQLHELRLLIHQSAPKFAKRFGVSDDLIYSIEKGKSPVSAELEKKIRTEIPQELLDQAQAEAERKDARDGAERRVVRLDGSSEEDAHYSQLERATRDPNLVYVPFLNVSASAGGGYLNDEYETPHKFLAFGREWVEHALGDDHSYAAAIKVVGDSMTPRLVDGDVVLVNTKVRTVQAGRVMIVWTAADGLKIKRVAKRDGIPWATSDNEKTTEEPQEFAFDERDLRGLVFWLAGGA